MKKIPTVLVRDPDDRAHVVDEVTPGCEWVLAGEGVPTRKYDGTCMMLDADGKWWARREVKAGKAAPANFVPEDHDEVTGKTQGWEPVEQSSFAKFHTEALEVLIIPLETPVGTYELIGPKINGNPEGSEQHYLVAHDQADVVFPDHGLSRSINQIKAQAEQMGLFGYEGIVWHHPDGRMAKLKARDIPAALPGTDKEP
jgi:hypothetical protein